VEEQPSYVLITTGLGSEQRACLEALDVLYFIGASGRCLETRHRGVLLIEMSASLSSFYSGALRYVLSHAKRLVPLLTADRFFKRWKMFTGTARPKCYERGTRGACAKYLRALAELNESARLSFSATTPVLHIETVDSFVGFFLLPAKCDSLDALYSSPPLRAECAQAVEEEVRLASGDAP